MLTAATGVTSAYGAKSQSADGSQAMGRDAFLKLLITQLQYQDPLKPMDDTQFISQLAQFSSLEQMQQLNGNMTPFMRSFDLYAANQSAANMIGRTITATDPNPPRDALGHLLDPKLDSSGNPMRDGSGNEVPNDVSGKVQSVRFTAEGPEVVVVVSQKHLDATGKIVTSDVMKEIPVAYISGITE